MRTALLPATSSLLAAALLTTTALSGQERAGAADAHWAFAPVRRPAVPAVRGGAAHPIDAFVRAKLAGAGLAQARTADKATLVRRLFLVMLGVPPTPEDVEAFSRDARDDAYEQLVDRVLADPRYGERWGRHWLDVVRFAESDGFETNHQRTNAWRYRDYVIAAFNEDLPYDQFVREQLAGDATGADVATGYLVGGPRDIVSSPDPALTAKQRADELDDMVATTGAAFLGLTVGCARCHAHKFDPIPQEDYYAFAAVFAGVAHGERALPPDDEQRRAQAALDARAAALERGLQAYRVAPPRATEGAPTRPPVQFTQNEEAFAPLVAAAVRFTVFATSNAEPCIDELEVFARDRNVALESAGATATASGTLPGYAIHQLEHVHDGRYGNGRSWISDEAGGGWVQVTFAKPERIDRIVWGRDRDGVVQDRLAVSYLIEARSPDGRWTTLASSTGRAAFAPGAQARAATVYRFDDLTTAAQQAGHDQLAAMRAARAERAELDRRRMAYAGRFAQPGATRLHRRGDPMTPGDEVPPGTLSLHAPRAMAADTPEQARRVQLAAWITDPSHPLTARVIVNRIWQHQFGVGLVATPSDFGRNGAAPSHPGLLDWLASELVDSGWSIKALQRLILTSSTWRQSSAPRADAARIDRDARLLWRFPPRRLEAEAIRDGMLAVSGQLDVTRGGPSFSLHDVGTEYVRAYRPKERFGAAEARRMVYALKVRTEPDAVFASFDCPDGSLATPRRGLSTTPLQSLNLWNSAFVMQQAHATAARVQRDAGDDVVDQIARAWQLALQRLPTAAERDDARDLALAEGLAAVCRALLNSNEFLFVP